MNSHDLTLWLAEKERISEAEAAAHLDELARRIRELVRSGQTVELPGLGRFEPGSDLRFLFDSRPAVRPTAARRVAAKRRG